MSRPGTVSGKDFEFLSVYDDAWFIFIYAKYDSTLYFEDYSFNRNEYASYIHLYAYIFSFITRRAIADGGDALEVVQELGHVAPPFRAPSALP